MVEVVVVEVVVGVVVVVVVDVLVVIAALAPHIGLLKSCSPISLPQAS